MDAPPGRFTVHVGHAKASQRMACIGRPTKDTASAARLMADGALLATRRRGLASGTAQNEQRKTTFAAFGPRQGRSTTRMKSLKAHAGPVRLGAEAQSDASGCLFVRQETKE